jgi:universal stress protein A
MHQLSRILVPVDFSACSRAALEQALWLAPSFGASIDVLHIADVPAFKHEPCIVAGNGTITLREYALRAAQSGLEAFLDELPRERRGHVVALVDAGHVRDCILAHARRGYDLVVMGTHGHSGRAHSLAGSVTESIVRLSACPVLTVREGA